MYVELVSASGGRIRVMAKIRSSGGQMQIEAMETIPPRILSDLEKQRGRIKGDEAFLRSLPLEMSGAYMRANLIKE